MTLKDLSPRERSVVMLRADFYSGKEIARQLGLSTKTVESHLRAARLKFQANSLSELLRRARLQMEVA